MLSAFLFFFFFFPVLIISPVAVWLVHINNCMARFLDQFKSQLNLRAVMDTIQIPGLRAGDKQIAYRRQTYLADCISSADLSN